jgi:hypothetical protein
VDGRLERRFCVDLRTNDAEWHREMFSQSYLNLIIFIIPAALVNLASSHNTTRDLPINLSTQLFTLILVNTGAVIHLVARQCQSDAPSVFDQIGTIADRIRKAAEWTWIPVPANDILHGGVALHTTQFLINQFFVRMKSERVM